MSLLKGGLTGRRFYVSGGPFENVASTFPVLLNDRAFHEPASPIWRHQIVGWCLADNLLDTDFAVARDRWLFNQYAVLGVRVERKVIPAPLLRAELDRRIRAWCAEHRRERAPASVRTEIRELLEDELLARTLPRVAVHEVVWNLVEGWILVGHGSEAVVDLVKKLMRDTFGVSLTEAGAAFWLPDYAGAWDALCALGATQLGSFPAPERESEPAEGATLPDNLLGDLDLAGASLALPHLLGDFLAWLWFRAERQDGRFTLPDGEICDAWIDDRVVTRHAVAGGRSALSSDHVAQERAAGAALASGQVLTEARIGIRRQGREYTGTLRGSAFTVASLKLPTECRTGSSPDEILYERMFLYEDFWYSIGQLYRLFVAERLNAHAWMAWTAPSMQAWAATLANAGTDGLDAAGHREQLDPGQSNAAERADAPAAVQVAEPFDGERDGPVALIRSPGGEVLARGTLRAGQATLRPVPRMASPSRPQPAPKPSAKPAKNASRKNTSELCPPALAALLRDARRFLDEHPHHEGYVASVLRDAEALREALEEGAVYDTAAALRVRGWTQGVDQWVANGDREDE